MNLQLTVGFTDQLSCFPSYFACPLHSLVLSMIFILWTGITSCFCLPRVTTYWLYPSNHLLFTAILHRVLITSLSRSSVYPTLVLLSNLLVCTCSWNQTAHLSGLIAFLPFISSLPWVPWAGSSARWPLCWASSFAFWPFPVDFSSISSVPQARWPSADCPWSFLPSPWWPFCWPN